MEDNEIEHFIHAPGGSPKVAVAASEDKLRDILIRLEVIRNEPDGLHIFVGECDEALSEAGRSRGRGRRAGAGRYRSDFAESGNRSPPPRPCPSLPSRRRRSEFQRQDQATPVLAEHDGRGRHRVGAQEIPPRPGAAGEYVLAVLRQTGAAALGRNISVIS